MRSSSAPTTRSTRCGLIVQRARKCPSLLLNPPLPNSVVWEGLPLLLPVVQKKPRCIFASASPTSSYSDDDRRDAVADQTVDLEDNLELALEEPVQIAPTAQPQFSQGPPFVQDQPDAGTAVSNRGLRKAVEAATTASNKLLDKITPNSDVGMSELTDLVQKQSIVMAKYQMQLDATNARLTQSQKQLSHLIEASQAAGTLPANGYAGSFLPPPQLSDAALRARADSQSPSAATEPSPTPRFFGPLEPDLNRSSVPPPPPTRDKWAAANRRALGSFDARFHSAQAGATPSDHRVLPERIILVRHAQSEGNIDNVAYTYIPDPQIPLTALGLEQSKETGRRLRDICIPQDGDGSQKLFFYTSPYRRSVETYQGIKSEMPEGSLLGVQEEVQLREQDFGNFQDTDGKTKEMAERLRFGRFFYRFPNGESGADVYDRITMFEDHMVRDINAGRFGSNTSLVLLTHGLSLRIFLMRWFYWTVDDFLNVFNPPNAVPLVLERVCEKEMADGGLSWIHTKCLYRLSDESRTVLKGITDDMCKASDRPNAFSRPQTVTPTDKKS